MELEGCDECGRRCGNGVAEVAGSWGGWDHVGGLAEVTWKKDRGREGLEDRVLGRGATTEVSQFLPPL